MPPALIKIIGVLAISVALWGLMTGKIMAGARGLRANYYYRKENPLLFYGFIFVYLAIGLVLLASSG